MSRQVIFDRVPALMQAVKKLLAEHPLGLVIETYKV